MFAVNVQCANFALGLRMRFSHTEDLLVISFSVINYVVGMNLARDA